VIIIGEKINASIPKSKIIIQEHDEKKLVELAREQAAAGADFIDVNVGTGIGSREDEIMSMEWAITTIQREVDTPLCIDSADHVVLEAGIKARD
jgi:cobalamin-dependent methionine synthase I